LHSASSDLSDVDADRPFAGMRLDKMRSSSAKPPARLALWTRRTFNPLGLKTSLGRSTRNGSRGSPHVWACLTIVPVLGLMDGTYPMRLPSAEESCVRAIRCYVLRLTPMGSCRTKATLFMGQDTSSSPQTNSREPVAGRIGWVSATGSSGLLLPSTLAHHIRSCWPNGKRPSEVTQVVCASNDSHGRSGWDSLEKQDGKIARHPHASVGRGISRQVTGVHPNSRAEFHEVRHRRGFIVAAPRYITAGSGIRVDHSSVSVDNQPEATRPMVDIFVENSKITRRR
jgi:hypothetical protein